MYCLIDILCTYLCYTCTLQVSDDDSISVAIAKFRLNITSAVDVVNILDALRKKLHKSPLAAVEAARGNLAFHLLECVKDVEPADEVWVWQVSMHAKALLHIILYFFYILPRKSHWLSQFWMSSGPYRQCVNSSTNTITLSSYRLSTLLFAYLKGCGQLPGRRKSKMIRRTRKSQVRHSVFTVLTCSGICWLFWLFIAFLWMLIRFLFC